MKKIRVLAKSFLFAGLQDENLRALAAVSRTREIDRGETIFHEGDNSDGFYLVCSGKVKIFKLSPEGKEQILHLFGEGEPFGEVAVFHGRPFPANAVGMEKSALLFFPKDDFIRLLEANGALSLNMIAVLAGRLRNFAAQIESLALKEVPERLKAHLLYLAEKQGNSAEVVLELPKGQLANLLGTSPETLSRVFARLSEQKVIEVNKNKITLMDRSKLAAL